MKAIFCLALILVSACAIDIRTQQGVFAQTSSRLSSAINQVKSNPFGEMLMSLAEIHMATAGPLEDLKTALEDLQVATVNAIDTENAEFDAATEQHESEVSRWEGLISSAETDIANTEALLNNVLYPRRESLENEIANLENNIENNIATTERETAQRAAEHEDFLKKESEYSLAIEAAEEALTLLAQLRNGEVSLAQVRVAQNSLKKVQEKAAKIQNNKFATFIKTLAQLAQNFSNQETLTKVISLVQDLKINCEEGLAQLRQNEADAVDLWENHRLPQLQGELASLRQSLFENETALTETNDQIASSEHFLATRTQDLADYHAGLDAENANYEVIVSTHNQKIDRLTTELGGINSAIELVNSRDFSEYFHANVNQL